LPANYDENTAYPVIYLLDGDWYFDDFSKELNDLIQGNTIEPCILIGIGYTSDPDQNRFRDYTFPSDEEYDIANGEADNFHLFLRNELIPNIEENYSTDPSQRVLMGHSLGGFNTLYNMFQEGTPFSGFVAVSSSIWWDRGYLFGLEEELSKRTRSLPFRTHISIGGDEPPSMTVLNETMIERLQSRAYTGFQLDSEFFKGCCTN
jgi:predicted alpha/beta superfamily hydrolase